MSSPKIIVPRGLYKRLKHLSKTTNIKIEEQQNHKPGFFERIGIKKVEKIEEDLPPISKIIDCIDIKIVETEQLKLQASYEKITIENEIQAGIRAKERAEYEKRRAKKEANTDPLEREYKQIVYGNPNHGISSFKEMLEMNKFTAEVRVTGNNAKVIEDLEKKHRQPEAIKQPASKNKPDLEPKTSTTNDPAQKERVEPKEIEKVGQASSVKEEFKNTLLEIRKQSQVRENTAKQSIKIKEDDWDMDR